MVDVTVWSDILLQYHRMTLLSAVVSGKYAVKLSSVIRIHSH